ncbi:MAG: PEP-CTERM sorting domain-containing protein [Pirellulales bacterium]
MSLDETGPRMRILAFSFVAAWMFLVCPSPAPAVITISVGSHPAQWQKPGQTFDILIGTDAQESISGVDLYLVLKGVSFPDIADADVYNPLLPRFTAIDFTGPGMVFSSVPSTTYPYGDPWAVANGTSYGQNIAYGVATKATSGPAASVLAEGVLARVTFDTTGPPSVYFDISLTDPRIFGPTLVSKITGPVPPAQYELVDGGIWIPEPSTLALAALGMIGALAWRWRLSVKA